MLVQKTREGKRSVQRPVEESGIETRREELETRKSIIGNCANHYNALQTTRQN